MLTRRDVAMLGWYGVLFSAIVFWANWRTSSDARAISRQMPRVSPGADTPDHVEEQQQLRRVMQRMMR